MKLGIISDTHHIDKSVIDCIMHEFVSRGVDTVIHCGDIEAEHWSAEAFNNFPVVCALLEEQRHKPELAFSPEGWAITKPGDRIVNLGRFKIYVGHKRSFDFLTGSENELRKILDQVAHDHDGVAWMFSGHTHHQIYMQGHPMGFINPGAVQAGFNGHEFAIVDTKSHEVIFSRVPISPSTGEPFTVGIISDTGNVSEQDEYFWQRLVSEFRKRDVSIVIHCGNIWAGDIGHEELSDFQVYAYMLQNQEMPTAIPGNWELISDQNPLIKIGGYRFYIQHDLSVDFLRQSEYEMSEFVRSLSKEHHHVDLVLCGLVHDALYAEGQEVTVINPGDGRTDRQFVTVCFPQVEVTFSSAREMEIGE